MGLLDDAIREHLDLKRRHGADPSEVERAEREALGPVRRAPEATRELEFRDQSMGEPSVALHEDEPDWDEPAFAAEPDQDEVAPTTSGGVGRFLRRLSRSAPEEPSASEQTMEDRADAGHEPSPFDEPEAGHHDRPPAADLTPPASRSATTPRPHPAGAPTGGETVEYDVADALQQAPPAADEDVLEETPEFLQDTPDHDRLWFEQRPPRDFDFDE
jgi:hypothetical protein